MLDRDRRFKAIKEAYARFEDRLRRRGRKPMRTTPFGFWGAASVDDTYDFFQQIHLEKHKRFGDLGCGDGRVVAVASLFTEAVGLEGDPDLVREALRLFATLPLGPVELRCADYLAGDLSGFDVLFINPDQFFSLKFERKLLDEFRGDLFVYNTIYCLNFLKKGKTYWANQMPIVHYPLRKAPPAG